MLIGGSVNCHARPLSPLVTALQGAANEGAAHFVAEFVRPVLFTFLGVKVYSYGLMVALGIMGVGVTP